MNRRAALLISVVVLGAAAAGLAMAMGQANAQPTNGLIAFARYRFVNSPLRREIWVANPDGTGQRRLTHVRPNYLDSNPVWAPDGSRILFTRCAPRNGVASDGRCTIWS